MGKPHGAQLVRSHPLHRRIRLAEIECRQMPLKPQDQRPRVRTGTDDLAIAPLSALTLRWDDPGSALFTRCDIVSKGLRSFRYDRADHSSPISQCQRGWRGWKPRKLGCRAETELLKVWTLIRTFYCQENSLCSPTRWAQKSVTSGVMVKPLQV